MNINWKEVAGVVLLIVFLNLLGALPGIRVPLIIIFGLILFGQLKDLPYRPAIVAFVAVWLLWSNVKSPILFNEDDGGAMGLTKEESTLVGAAAIHPFSVLDAQAHFELCNRIVDARANQEFALLPERGAAGLVDLEEARKLQRESATRLRATAELKENCRRTLLERRWYGRTLLWMEDLFSSQSSPSEPPPSTRRMTYSDFAESLPVIPATAWWAAVIVIAFLIIVAGLMSSPIFRGVMAVAALIFMFVGLGLHFRDARAEAVHSVGIPNAAPYWK